MTDFTISTEHNSARLAATIAFADGGAAASSIDFYDSAEVLLATIHLARPCGVVSSDKLVLSQADPTADLVLATGLADHAIWRRSDATLVARGPVTDETGIGPFVLQGAGGLNLYAGGLIVLGVTAIA